MMPTHPPFAAGLNLNCCTKHSGVCRHRLGALPPQIDARIIFFLCDLASAHAAGGRYVPQLRYINDSHAFWCLEDIGMALVRIKNNKRQTLTRAQLLVYYDDKMESKVHEA